MKTIYLTFLALNIFLSSCVVYHKTEDVHKTITTNINLVEKNQISTDIDYRNKINIYQWLEEYIVNKDLYPFKSITIHKNDMSEIHRKLSQKTNKIKGLKFTFERLSKGKKEIKSNEKIWSEFKEIKKSMKNISTEINDLNLKYVSASNAFSNSISNSNFKTLNKNELKTNFENTFSQFSIHLKSTNEDVIRYREELENAKKNIPDSIYIQKSDILNNIEKLLSDTEIKQTEIKQYLIVLLNQPILLNQKDQIWIGENTKTQIHINKINDGMSKINEAQGVFNSLSNKLNENY
jgi:hypothetical protein